MKLNWGLPCTRSKGHGYIYIYINIGSTTIARSPYIGLGHCPASYTNDVKAGINDYILAMSLFRIFKILKYSFFGHQNSIQQSKQSQQSVNTKTDSLAGLRRACCEKKRVNEM